jgi:hypothetical protein
MAVIGFLLLTLLAAGAVILGSILQRRDPLPVRPAVVASPSASASIAVPGGPADTAVRATWLANALPLPSLQNGAGPVSLTIDALGIRLSVNNFAPGAAFESSVDQDPGGGLRIVLGRDSGGCSTGAEGIYSSTLSQDGMLLTLAKVSDPCTSRGEALARTWARSLVENSFRGGGIVDTMDPTFAVTLPDDSYQARTLDDFIEIGGSNGFSLIVLKNPQGFADSCSDQQVRYPYTQGAAAFVQYFRQNDAFLVLEASPLKIDGHDAIHLVTNTKIVGARCPGAELYAFTPKACNCHFFAGDDSFYLVDVGSDTFLFELSPPLSTAAEAPIIDTIRIPYELPIQ